MMGRRESRPSFFVGGSSQMMVLFVTGGDCDKRPETYSLCFVFWGSKYRRIEKQLIRKWREILVRNCPH